MQPAGLTKRHSESNRAIMTRIALLLALATSAAALSGCGNNGETVVIGPDGRPVDDTPPDVSNVELPPSIVASHAYRCRDNSLVYVDWLSNDTARVKMERREIGTTVMKGEDGAYTAEGQSLTGDPQAQSITLNGKSCKR